MYTLYAYPNTYAFGAHALLEEIGVSYTIIDPRTASDNVAFLHASPHGRVPALTLPDGLSICESGAIALYLADTLAEQKFTVAADHPERAAYLQWLFYLSSTLQPDVMLQFHPEHYFSKTQSQLALKAAAMDRLDDIWPVLDRQYQSSPWMFDERPTAIDFSLAIVLLWPECFRSGLESFPHLSRMLSELKMRSAFQRVLAWHKGNHPDQGSN